MSAAAGSHVLALLNDVIMVMIIAPRCSKPWEEQDHDGWMIQDMCDSIQTKNVGNVDPQQRSS